MDKFELYQSVYNWMVRNVDVYGLDRFHAFELLCQRCSEVMNVDRIEIWFLNPNEKKLREEITFTPGQVSTFGKTILEEHLPSYFQRLFSDKVIVSNNVLVDPQTKDLLSPNFTSKNIHALIDSLIISDGKTIGVLRIENLDKPRTWDFHDINFATTFSDFLGRYIETVTRHSFEKDLIHRIDFLEKDLRGKLDDLNEAKLSLDLALESAQVGKWDWNIQTDKLYLNKTWFTKLGYTYDEIPQSIETFKSVIYPEDLSKVLKEIDRHLQGISPFYECRYRMITKTREVQWCLDRGCIIYRNNDGTPERFIGVNVNVTPIVKWKQSLTLSEQQLKSMIRSLPTPVSMFNKELHQVACSTRWREEWSLFGLPEEKELKQPFIDQWLPKLYKALQGEVQSEDEELIDFGDGNKFWLRWIIQPWNITSDEVGGVVIMAENITRRKETEIRLTQTSKLSALGEMAGGIAHEINNPLSVIKGYVDLLRRHSLRKTLAPELLTQYINKMDQTVSRISRIVNGMRRFARESSMDEKVCYSLNKIVEETLDICLEKINNNGTSVQVDYLTGDSDIMCRPVEISQVILNLINNAYQATSSYPHPWIRIKMEELPDTYRIQISDCGEKIPDEVKEKLFQPFFTTKEVGVGTGLGLSISRGIIEEHKGKLSYLESAPNTTFELELPKASPREIQLTH